jgi:hypothetical protein
MIQTLDIMEGDIDKYLNYNKLDSNLDNKDHIHETASETIKIMDNIQKDLDDINSKIIQSNYRNEEGLRSLNYENKRYKENITIDV